MERLTTQSTAKIKAAGAGYCEMTTSAQAVTAATLRPGTGRRRFQRK